MEGVTDLEILKKDVGRKLRELADKLGKDIKEVMDLFKQEYSREDLKGYPEEVKLKYALRLTYAKSRTLLNTVRLRRVIPIAQSPIKKLGGGSYAIFVSCFLPNDRQFIHLQFLDENLEKVKEWEEEIELFKLYEDVRVKATNSSDVFNAIPETKLNGGKELNMDYDEFLGSIGIKKLNCLKDLASNIHTTGTLFSMREMKIVSGIIVSVSEIEAKGAPICIYHITDESLPVTEETVGNGVILSPTIAVWCSTKFAIYDEGSDISVLGYILQDRASGRVSMTGEFIYPNTIVHMRRR